MLTSTWRPGIERTAEEPGAQADRLAKHLFMTSTTAPPGEGVADHRHRQALVKGRREAWSGGMGRCRAPAGERGMAHDRLGDLRRRLRRAVVFLSSPLGLRPGDVPLVVAAGSRLSTYFGATVGETGFLGGIWPAVRHIRERGGGPLPDLECAVRIDAH
jgi:ATP-binding cassette subfamily B protein